MAALLRACLLILVALSFAGTADAERNVVVERDVVYGHKVGLALTYDVVRPQESANGSGVLFMVSGGWFSTWIPPENMVRGESDQPNPWEALIDRGFTVFFVRHGSGEKFTVPEAVDDVRRAALHIRANAKRFSVDPERLGVFGGSAGGHLSLMLGTTAAKVEMRPNEDSREQPDTPVVAAVVALFPPTALADYVTDEEFRERFPALKFDAEIADAVSPLVHVSSDDAPALLIHGTEDELVPIKHSEQIHAAFQAQDVPSELLIIDGAGHSFHGDDERRVIRAMVDWFAHHLLDEADDARLPQPSR